MSAYIPRTIEAYFADLINPETGFPYDPYPVYVTDEELHDYVDANSSVVSGLGFDTDGVPFYDPDDLTSTTHLSGNRLVTEAAGVLQTELEDTINTQLGANLSDIVETVNEIPSTYAPIGLGFGRSPIFSTKIRGANIAPKPGGHGWEGLFAEWDWNNWIKPQVDRAVALRLNAVRLIGSPNSVLVDPIGGSLLKITEAQYLAHWAQLADYCLRKGLYLYPVLVSKWDYIRAGVGFQDTTVNALVASSAGVLGAYSNVIGFDLFQEGDSVYGVTSDDVITAMAAARSTAPAVPVTCSWSTGQATGWNDVASLSYQVLIAPGGSDYADLHIYLDNVDPASVDHFLQKSGKPLLIGEFGASADMSGAARTARYQAIAAIHNRTDVSGSFAWALADQTTDPADSWGLYDNTGFGPAFPAVSTAPLSVSAGKRTDVTDTLPLFDIRNKPLPYSPPNLITAAQARPKNDSSGYQAGSNTGLTSDARGVIFTSAAIGTTLIGTKTGAAWRAQVAPNAYYRGTATLLAATTARAVLFQIDWYNSSMTYLSSSTAATGTDSTNMPLTLSLIVKSHSSALYGLLVARVTDAAQAAGESHILVSASLHAL